ncbi:hypothetical protein EG878_16885, partial [Enterococcus faecalis]
HGGGGAGVGATRVASGGGREPRRENGGVRAGEERGEAGGGKREPVGGAVVAVARGRQRSEGQSRHPFFE